MSQYATKTDLVELAVSPRMLDGVSDEMIDRMLAAASATADSYIRSRYSLPLTTWGDDLRLAITRIAALLIVSARGMDPNDPTCAVFVNGRDSAMKWLVDVSSGRASLDVVVTSPSAGQAARVYSLPKRGW